jgi:hypothetical protein
MTKKEKPILTKQEEQAKELISDPLAAFNHLFQLDMHEYETTDEYEERLIVRDQFIAALKKEGHTPESYLLALQTRYGKLQ